MNSKIIKRESVDRMYLEKSTNCKGRAPNFSSTEKIMLLEIAGKYRDIIENKRTDKSTTNSKNKCWQTIQIDFNAHTDGTYRNVIQLRNLYDQIKKKARKEKSASMVAPLLTGEGDINENKQISELTNKVFELIGPIPSTRRTRRLKRSKSLHDDGLKRALSQYDDDFSHEEHNVAAIECDDTIESIPESLESAKTCTPIIQDVFEEFVDVKSIKETEFNNSSTSTKNEDELMAMRRERHELEMSVLKEQHILLLNCHRDQADMMKMKRERHAIELAILREQHNQLVLKKHL